MRLAEQPRRIVLSLAGSLTARQIPLGAVAPALPTLVPQDTGLRRDVWNVLQHAHAAVRVLADAGAPNSRRLDQVAATTHLDDDTRMDPEVADATWAVIEPILPAGR